MLDLFYQYMYSHEVMQLKIFISAPQVISIVNKFRFPKLGTLKWNCHKLR